MWLWWTDPLGALVIAFYILRGWVGKCIEQMQLIIGKTASPQFLQKITYIACNHHPDIEKIDTVRAFHFGSNFLVEVDVVLRPTMPLREAHDVGESLQKKLETLEDVERAFVHLDYEYSHKPEHYDEYEE
eukprot:GEZU01029716.1.p1 GENE.GEZU01029716.1~~GEZU01029716.1.p1  ORF type:complete len:130 (-),score=31.45 GEZU01029716.1:126-515(-)